MPKPTLPELDVLFRHHVPPAHAGTRIGIVRQILRDATEAILSQMPECDEMQLVVDKMCEAMYHANGGIAREAARLSYGHTVDNSWRR